MKFKSTLSFLIKIGIVIFSLYFLYNELVLKKNIKVKLAIVIAINSRRKRATKQKFNKVIKKLRI